jgi:hypothetical protein
MKWNESDLQALSFLFHDRVKSKSKESKKKKKRRRKETYAKEVEEAEN